MKPETMRSTLPLAFKAAFWISLAALTFASLVPVALLPPQALNVWDKAQHALGFAWLAAWGLLAYPKNGLVVAVGLVLWGGAIELMQAATGWRYGEWIDWLADAIGVAAAWALWRGLPTRWSRRA